MKLRALYPRNCLLPHTGYPYCNQPLADDSRVTPFHALFFAVHRLVPSLLLIVIEQPMLLQRLTPFSISAIYLTPSLNCG